MKSINEMTIGENRLNVNEAKAYLAEVLNIVEWACPHDDIRTWQRRFGGEVQEEGITVEYDNESGEAVPSASISYYVQCGDVACLRFKRNSGRGEEGSDLPFYGTAEDAADFLTGWLRERVLLDEYDYEPTKAELRDGYVPHEMGAAARRRVTERVREAAIRYRAKREAARREQAMEKASKKKAKAVTKKVEPMDWSEAV